MPIACIPRGARTQWERGGELQPKTRSVLETLAKSLASDVWERSGGRHPSKANVQSAILRALRTTIAGAVLSCEHLPNMESSGSNSRFSESLNTHASLLLACTC